MQRTAPPLTERTGAYWRSGADGVLRIAQCQSCKTYLHPPAPCCPQCRSRDIGFSAASGRGAVYSFTINRYQWAPGMTPPYVLAEVDLDEQQGLRILTNIVDIAPEDVRIGMRVCVRFDQTEDAYIPVFAP
jgi:uncharacterized OB-fold protein